MRRTVILLTTVVLALLLAVPAMAGGGGGGAICRGFGAGDELVLLDSCFEGTGHIVEAGTTLTVSNQGEMPHTFTAVDRSFDSGVLEPGESWQLTVPEAGNVPVYCTLHASPEGDGMAGLLVVSAAGATSPVTSDAGVEASAAGWGWWLAGLALVAIAGLLLARRRGVSAAVAPSPAAGDLLWARQSPRDAEAETDHAQTPGPPRS
jgi:hypothetical protein